MFDQLMADQGEQAAVLALVAATRGKWYETATLIDQAGSAIRLLGGHWSGLEPFDVREADELSSRTTQEDLERAGGLIASLADQGVRLITILDDDYPINLRTIYNRPPFLFVRGAITGSDERAVAVVGTREASPEGLHQANRLAKELARQGVTVLSGMARGIDTAAHRGALQAGGRTVAVMGTGIDHVYPPENEELASDIVKRGALVSQFWPGASPTRYSFPMRNVVMSGMSMGTVVIEASSTSGARMQTRLAIEHGKRVFLLEGLVTKQAWARRVADHPLTTVVRSIDDILDALVTLAEPPKQLSFG